ncbi:MOSC domain-containing protein [Allopusillimonas ginsengisoli]|uniref:MOSC domain-containing protein n=1 Tax=Allopusillimonas ginsengisoli TaxID=453575 RepID=UPI00101F3A83|nr:MOSC N-terminal beta barrel domain-containing protein [Allopusillimonas ginsengisoli]TEA76977.1 MOSC domain-containing protein [Allopusillimonas ginsengisoli]
MTVRILSLHSYPIKSCAGVNHDQATILRGGLPMDRHWVIVDSKGIFMTQRQYARMALVQPGLPDGANGDLTLSAPGMPQLAVSGQLPANDPQQVSVRIWAADTTGFDEGDAAAQWLSQFLGVSCRLLRVHPRANRVASPKHVDAWLTRNREWAGDFPASHPFAFADGFPFLVAGQQSLEELNRRLVAKGQPAVPMNRFRPNIVLDGLDPYEEDYLSAMRAGAMTFAFVKRCARCPIPNIDQATALSAPEPGITLAEHRQFPDGVLFGVNAVVAGADDGALLRVGDDVEPEFDL